MRRIQNVAGAVRRKGGVLLRRAAAARQARLARKMDPTERAAFVQDFTDEGAELKRQLEDIDHELEQAQLLLDSSLEREQFLDTRIRQYQKALQEQRDWIADREAGKPILQKTASSCGTESGESEDEIDLIDMGNDNDNNENKKGEGKVEEMDLIHLGSFEASPNPHSAAVVAASQQNATMTTETETAKEKAIVHDLLVTDSPEQVALPLPQPQQAVEMMEEGTLIDVDSKMPQIQFDPLLATADATTTTTNIALMELLPTNNNNNNSPSDSSDGMQEIEGATATTTTMNATNEPDLLILVKGGNATHDEQQAQGEMQETTMAISPPQQQQQQQAENDELITIISQDVLEAKRQKVLQDEKALASIIETHEQILMHCEQIRRKIDALLERKVEAQRLAVEHDEFITNQRKIQQQEANTNNVDHHERAPFLLSEDDDDDDDEHHHHHPAAIDIEAQQLPRPVVVSTVATTSTTSLQDAEDAAARSRSNMVVEDHLDDVNNDNDNDDDDEEEDDEQDGDEEDGNDDDEHDDPEKQGANFTP